MYTAGFVSTRFGLGEKSGISNVEDMCSVPPATMVVAKPLMILSAANAMVCSPDEQKRFTVCAGTVSGSPARIALRRAML
jgi:hypothetical protein